MNVLDELRAEILVTRIVCDGCGKPLRTVGAVHEHRWVAGDRFPELCGVGIATTLIDPEDVAEAFDAFEARHPDLTECSITSCAAHKEDLK